MTMDRITKQKVELLLYVSTGEGISSKTLRESHQELEQTLDILITELTRSP